jgi:hypothetical protein
MAGGDIDRDVSFVYFCLTGTSINLALPIISHFTQGLRTHHADISKKKGKMSRRIDCEVLQASLSCRYYAK